MDFLLSMKCENTFMQINAEYVSVPSVFNRKISSDPFTSPQPPPDRFFLAFDTRNEVPFLWFLNEPRFH